MKKVVTKIRVAPRLITWFIALILKMWGATQRFQRIDPQGILSETNKKPYIFVIWHNRLVLMMVMAPKYVRERFCFLASRSRDGGYIADILERFDMIPVRGSTGKKGVDKGGARALVQLRKRLKEGLSIGLTPDGPRGPKYTVNSGVIWLASKSGVPIIPASYNSDWHLELRSWDRTQIPLPFSKGRYTLGEPIEIPPDLDDEGLEEYKEKVRQGLMAITEGDHDH